MSRSRGKVVDRDRGWKKFRARGKELSKQPGVTVGLHAAEGGKQHKAGNDRGPPLTVLDVGTIHEFGLGLPERSFIRAWFDAAKPENYALAHRMLVRVMLGQISVEDALNQMGAYFAGQIQLFIAQNKVQPPDRPTTIAIKGSSVTLIDRGQLRQSLTWKVVK